MEMIRSIGKSALSSASQLRDRIRWASYTRIHCDFDRSKHLREAMEWLKRAQDAGTDRGVAYGATLGGAFMASYPETTGYIIQTFVDWARRFNDDECLHRAIDMGDWEIEIQLDCGAVMGGAYNADPTPAVFNTGQVLLGWAALFRATNEKRFLEAGRRAADWLVKMQEADGNWIKGNSQYANDRSTVYNVKAAWGMLELARAGGWDELASAAERNAEFCLTRQRPNGWFADCCLTDPANPLLHTIAYTMQGLVGIGQLVERPDFIEAAASTAKAVMAVMDEYGFIPGRFNDQFEGTVSWCCLTGSAQTSIVWSKMYELTGDEEYREARERVNRYLMARHNITSGDPVVRGAVFGSWPLWGEYGKKKVLNWATKFFVDALLLED